MLRCSRVVNKSEREREGGERGADQEERKRETEKEGDIRAHARTKRGKLLHASSLGCNALQQRASPSPARRRARERR